MGNALGIDIGTAHSRVALAIDRTPALLLGEDAAVPSVVSWKGGAARVGQRALALAATQPSLSVHSVKRLLGRLRSDSLVVRYAARAPFTVGTGSDGGPRLKLGDASFAPADLFGALLRDMLDRAATQWGDRVESAVFSAPAWLGPLGREAITSVAEECGLAGARVVTDTTLIGVTLAAAAGEEHTALVVDLGAGGLSAAVLAIAPQQTVALSEVGDGAIGGEDVDVELMRVMLAACGLDDRVLSDEATEQLRQASEALKRELSRYDEVSVTLPFLASSEAEPSPHMTMQKAELSPLLGALQRRVASACKLVINASHLSSDRIDIVYAAGGMGRLSAIRDAIQRATGAAHVMPLPLDAVAWGAALYASMQAGRIEGMRVSEAVGQDGARPSAEEGPKTPGALPSTRRMGRR